MCEGGECVKVVSEGGECVKVVSECMKVMSV